MTCSLILKYPHLTGYLKEESNLETSNREREETFNQA